jgi:cytochrome bd-type quinol oxidase subunit 2
MGKIDSLEVLLLVCFFFFSLITVATRFILYPSLILEEKNREQRQRMAKKVNWILFILLFCGIIMLILANYIRAKGECSALGAYYVVLQPLYTIYVIVLVLVASKKHNPS